MPYRRPRDICSITVLCGPVDASIPNQYDALSVAILRGPLEIQRKVHVPVSSPLLAQLFPALDPAASTTARGSGRIFGQRLSEHFHSRKGVGTCLA